MTLICHEASNVTAAFMPVAKTIASDPEGQLSDQPDIPGRYNLRSVER